MATSANFAGDASLPLPLVLGSAGPALPSGCGTIGDRMSALVRLRPWQKAALERFAACDRPDFLAVATPGAGKTTFALTAALSDLATHPRRRIVVVAPTHHLKTQWARAAAAFGLHLEPAWSPRGGRLPADMHGVVVTYQQMAADPGSLRAVTRDAFVVFDEVHHAGEDRAWGDGLRHAFEPAARRLSISGTPFRSDTQAIPFVDYVGDEAVPDYTYGYAAALRDGGVVRPAYFPRVGGEMEWTAAGWRRCCAGAWVCRPWWRRRRTWRPRRASAASPTAGTRGSWPCGWCQRASTSRGCAWVCTPPTPPPSCSSARRLEGWCAGPAACARRRRSCSSPMTSGCDSTPPASARIAATACGAATTRMTHHLRISLLRSPRGRSRMSSCRCSPPSAPAPSVTRTCPSGRSRRPWRLTTAPSRRRTTSSSSWPRHRR